MLRPPRLRDARAWSEIRLRNEAWLAPWEPTSPHTWDDRNARQRLAAAALGAEEGRRGNGTMLPFMIAYGGRLVGQVNVSNVVHGVLRSCTVGYWIDAAVAGRGHHPDRARAGHRPLLRRGRAAPRRGRHPAGERASLRVVEKLGCAGRAFYERLPRHRRRLARSHGVRGHRRGVAGGTHAVAGWPRCHPPPTWRSSRWRSQPH